MTWVAAKRVVAARDGGNCLRCLGPATDVHHRLVKGMGGSKDPLVAGLANLVSLCRICHDWVHAHPGEAYKAGWLVLRGTVPGDAPIRLNAGEWLWLTDDGNARCDGRRARFLRDYAPGWDGAAVRERAGTLAGPARHYPGSAGPRMPAGEEQAYTQT